MSRSGVLVKLGLKAVRSRAFRESDVFMDEFIDCLTNLGGVYAKFLQSIILGYSVNSRSTQKSQNILSVYEDNPDPNLTVSDLDLALNYTHGRVKVTSILPLGVGSYSAVYSSLLDDKTEVIVKLLRPGVRDEIHKDLAFLRKLAFILKHATPSELPLDVGQMFGSFKKACQNETDFASEMAFASSMHDRYVNHPHIKIPRTYTDLCSQDVIVQEKLIGLSLKDVVAARIEGKNPYDFAHHKTGTDMKYK
jgi:ABC1 atypical kinase-like domain